MKFRDYITEQEKIDPIKVRELKQLLKRDCKKFLNESDKLLWRGTFKTVKDWLTIAPRKDRSPMSTGWNMHEWADRYFQKYFGWKARSEGVFVSPKYHTASYYGNPCMFFPIGNYKYIWSPDIEDFTFDVDGAIASKKIKLTIPIDTNTLIGKELDTLMKSYVSKGLNKNKESEIMFKCDKYYLVNSVYKDHIGDLL